MIELCIDSLDWKDNPNKFKKMVEKLENFGWNKIEQDSSVIFHKNVMKFVAENELDMLGIKNVDILEWTEVIETF